MEKILKTGLDGAYGEIMVIGYAIEDSEPQAIFRDSIEASEKEMLTQWFETLTTQLKLLSKSDNPIVKIIGHNVRAFDNMFLYNRCVILGVRPPQWFLRCLDSSPYSDEVFDTMTRFCGFRNTISLSKLVDVLDLQAKGSEIEEEIDGSQVWSFIEQNKINEVVEYCKGDVKRCQQAYKRMNFLD